MQFHILKDKIAGTLMGLAIGDILGMAYLYENILNDFTKGEYSDSTQMTIINVRSIIANNWYYKNNIILEYEKWAKEAIVIGKNTKSLFRGAKTIKEYHYRWNINTEIMEQTNESLMRCSMLSYLWDDNIIKIDCELTNPHINEY